MSTIKDRKCKDLTEAERLKRARIHRRTIQKRYLLGGSDGKESAFNAGDVGVSPGLGRSPGEGNATHSSILAWEIPWTEELGGLQFMGSQKSRTGLCD